MKKWEDIVLERRYRYKGHTIFGQVVPKGKLYDKEVVEILWEAVENGKILDEEKNDVLDTGLFWYGEREDRWVVLVVEVSHKINNDAVEKAKRRAEILRRAGAPAIPIVAGTEMEEGLKLEEIAYMVNDRISDPEFEKLFDKFSQAK